MLRNQFTNSLLMFILLFTSTLSIQAASSNQKKEHIFKNETLVTKKTKKKGILRKWQEKKLGKILQEQKEIEKQANASIIISLISYIFLFTPIASVLFFVGLLTGAIFAVIALTRIRHSENGQDYKKAKKRAKWGIFLSLIFPVILTVGVLAWVASQYGW